MTFLDFEKPIEELYKQIEKNKEIAEKSNVNMDSTIVELEKKIVDLKKKRRIEDSWIASRCGWTPFAGQDVTGWPTHTIIGGKIVMQDDQLLQPALGRKIIFS